MKQVIKTATLADVAALAGVSLGSASRALSVPEEVKPGTLEKVNQAVAQLGYVKNGAAQALASKKTHTIAAIYPTLDNPIYASSVNALQKSLWKIGYQLLIASHEYDRTREVKAVQTMVERGVDGIILVGTDHDDAVFEMLSRRQIPYVLSWSTDATSYPHCVGFSNQQASFEMAKLILAKGHQKIAVCTGFIAHNERARARVAGTLLGLEQVGLTVPSEYIVEAPLSIEGGKEGFRKLWNLKNHPTVIVFGNDLQAIGAIDESRNLGVRIPEDVSITGFDDINLASIVNPPLTTIRVPINDIGIRSAQMISDLISSKKSNQLPIEEPLLKTEVIERSSLANPPKNI
jgi:LacI family transcriptional regulator